MSGNEKIRTFRKKLVKLKPFKEHTIKNKYMHHNKIITSNRLYKIDNDDYLIAENSNELLNENI